MSSVSPCVLCRGCLRLPANCPSTSCPTCRRSVRCWILAELNWTEHGSATMYVVMVFFCCARLSHCGSCCGPPTAFPCGHRCTVGVLAGTHRCALMPRVASRQSANPLWLLECGLVIVLWWSSKQGQRDCTLLLLMTILDSCHWNVRILTPLLDESRCSASTSSLQLLRLVVAVLDVLFNEILLPTNLDQHALHLVRNLIAPFLLACCSAAVHLVHPDVDLFHFSRDCSASKLSGTTAAGPAAGTVAAAGVGPVALEKLPHGSLSVRAATTMFVFCVSISFCKN